MHRRLNTLTLNEEQAAFYDSHSALLGIWARTQTVPKTQNATAREIAQYTAKLLGDKNFSGCGPCAARMLNKAVALHAAHVAASDPGDEQPEEFNPVESDRTPTEALQSTNAAPDDPQPHQGGDNAAQRTADALGGKLGRDEAVAMRLQGKTYAEIAATLGVSASTARKWCLEGEAEL